MKRVLWLMGFLIIALISWPEEAVAMVSCGPSPCTPKPGCGESCTYQECTGTAEQKLPIKELPFTITLPDDACGGDTPKFYDLPFSHEGTSYKTLPTDITDSYNNICQTVTVSNESCPKEEPPKEEPPKEPPKE